jgi:zinc protease
MIRTAPGLAATFTLGLALSGAALGADEPVNVRVPAHERQVLGNGLRLVLVPMHEVPLVSATLVLRGGARADAPGHAGTATLTADLLTRGAAGRDAYAFADAVEGAGGTLDAEAQDGAIRVGAQFLAPDAGLMLELLADAVQRPRFEARELETLRTRRIEELKAAKDSSPGSLVDDYGRARLFGEHPYGRPAGGTEASLAAVDRGDVQQYFHDHFGADRAILVVAGDFEPRAMRALVARHFARWGHAATALAPLAAAPRRHGRRVLLIDAPGSAQTYIWMGNVGVPRRYPQRAALNIASIGFGGGFGSMLNEELRTKSGLSYSAGAGFNRAEVAGEFAISTFTRTDSTARAVQLVLDTLARLHAEGTGAERVESARRLLIGQYPLAYQTAANWAGAFADLEFYGLPDSYISGAGSELLQVDAAAVRTVIAREFPAPEDLEVVLVGDAARIRDSLAPFGPVTERALSEPGFGATAPNEQMH